MTTSNSSYAADPNAALTQSSQSVLTGVFSEPTLNQLTVYPPPPGGSTLATSGSGTYYAGAAESISPALDPNTLINTPGTAGSVPSNIVPAPNTGDGSLNTVMPSATASTAAATPSTSMWGNLFPAIGQTIQGDWNLLTGSNSQSTFGAGSYVSNTAVAASGGAAGAIQSGLNTALPAAGNAVSTAASDIKSGLLFGLSSVELLVLVTIGAIGYLIASGNVKKVIPV